MNLGARECRYDRDLQAALPVQIFRDTISFQWTWILILTWAVITGTQDKAYFAYFYLWEYNTY